MNALAEVSPLISKLIPRLASEHDGEVVATVRAIERTLKAVGHDWHDLVLALQFQPAENRGDWRALARFCAGNQLLLSPREIEFIAGISRLHRISEKQQRWLRDIAARLRAAA
jgi:hypothetical protein